MYSAPPTAPHAIRSASSVAVEIPRRPAAYGSGLRCGMAFCSGAGANVGCTRTGMISSFVSPRAGLSASCDHPSRMSRLKITLSGIPIARKRRITGCGSSVLGVDTIERNFLRVRALAQPSPHDNAERDHTETRHKKQRVLPARRKSQKRQRGHNRASEDYECIKGHGEILSHTITTNSP